MSFQSEVVIDGRGHLYGRLASTVAKQILIGQKVTVVRCEDMFMSGAMWRSKLKWAAFRVKAMNTNPQKGQFHYRAPSKMFWRSIRGMVPHKTARGAAALDRLKTFEGIPHPYDKKKRMVVPAALKCTRLKPNRKFTHVGTWAKNNGWGMTDVIARLEAKRKVKSASFFTKKKALFKTKADAAKKVKLSKDQEALIKSCQA
eukprot:gnl/MRDRNA2_/MRDRNA2_81456_c0_seq1.p1 gnl/MRDRNA2_/MRDRNA2_81456_c0~~gnl/MRDRNA2_/MRDRNA2_81456_c0_seq1.p1  ORF type:complete len:201 (+),score=50.96 gnl/MRDRNA2_/MRDRNA2_81456_c0_seq1:77-679(+)